MRASRVAPIVSDMVGIMVATRGRAPLQAGSARAQVGQALAQVGGLGGRAHQGQRVR